FAEDYPHLPQGKVPMPFAVAQLNASRVIVDARLKGESLQRGEIERQCYLFSSGSPADHAVFQVDPNRGGRLPRLSLEPQRNRLGSPVGDGAFEPQIACGKQLAGEGMVIRVVVTRYSVLIGRAGGRQAS